MTLPSLAPSRPAKGKRNVMRRPTTFATRPAACLTVSTWQSLTRKPVV